MPAEHRWNSVNFGTINDFGAEMALDFNLLQLIPSQRFFKKFGVAYSYINQDKTEQAGIVSKYALEYLKNKVVSNLQINLWRNLDLGLNYRFQHRMGSYLDVNNQRHKYRSYGVMDARLSWNDKSWTAYLEANNLFETYYLDYGNVPQPGTWVIGGIRINL